MNIREVIQSDIEKSIEKAGLSVNSVVKVVHSSDSRFGDYASNWSLQVAKELNQSPSDIAKKIEANLEKSEVYEPPTISDPGFINFTLKSTFLAQHLKLVLAEGDKFGSGKFGRGQTVLVEFSSPNIAKPMNIGHLRNTNIGQALVNIIGFNGYQTISDNHLGDWGTQFGKLLWAYKKWGQGISEPSISQLLELYVRFHDEADSNPEMNASARHEFKKLEQGDKENRILWEKFKSLSLGEFEKIYHDLNVKFDQTLGESFYEKLLPEVVSSALKTGVAKRDPDGSVLIPIEGMPPFLILKSDGGTLYGTRDIATAKYRIDKIKKGTVLYVIASEQTLYMQQLFIALSKLGLGKDITWEHISYGLTRLPQGRMSTRSGDLITAEEILTEAKNRARKIISAKDQRGSLDEELVRSIAIGAVKWNDLKLTRESEVVFDWEQVFSVEGNTGPYIQYSIARVSSLISKSGIQVGGSNVDATLLVEPSELEIMRHLVRFPEIIKLACESYQPHLICQYSFELAQLFSRFYEQVPVLTAGSGLKESRLALARAVETTLRTSLRLLAIDAPSRL